MNKGKVSIWYTDHNGDVIDRHFNDVYVDYTVTTDHKILVYYGNRQIFIVPMSRVIQAEFDYSSTMEINRGV